MNPILYKLFPNYDDRIQKSTNNQEIKGNVSFQILTYFNILYFPVWIIVTLSSLIFKFLFAEFQYLNLISIIFAVVEVARLYLAFNGNHREQVSDLTGSTFLSIFPQLVILLASTFMNYISSGFVLPIEFGTNLIYLTLLVAEIVVGFQATQTLVKIQNMQLMQNFNKEF